MRRVPQLTPAEAAAWIDDGDTVVVAGSGGGIVEPSALLRAVERRFLDTGAPTGLTAVHVSGLGDRAGGGIGHWAHPGLVRRVVCGHYGMSPNMAELALSGEIEAYNLPQGVLSLLMRENAARRLGLLTHVGLRTFVDPRLEGGRVNEATREDLVEVLEVKGREHLFYPTFPVDVALIRATTADELGNLTLEREAAFLEPASMAAAARNTGGKVIAQVQRLARAGTLDPQRTKVPGAWVDAIVVDPEQPQTCLGGYDPALSGEVRVPQGALPPLEPGPRKVVAARAAQELTAGQVINLGVGMPDGIGAIVSEQGRYDDFTFALEQGLVGGTPRQGVIFGASANPAAILDAPYQFDFFHGGGLDAAFLGMGEVDREGDVNVSRLGDRLMGCGGFIDITQNAKQVVFCGSFTAAGLRERVADGRLHIEREGSVRKFVDRVQQVTFSAAEARASGKEVLYVTERAVFRLAEAGLELLEVAPGIDLERDVLAQMAFRPRVEGAPRTMDAAAFG